MTYKKPFAALTIGLLCSMSSLSFAADEPSVTLDRPGAGAVEMKIGDIVPAEYQRESLEIKDWKNRKLKAPVERTQLARCSENPGDSKSPPPSAVLFT